MKRLDSLPITYESLYRLRWAERRKVVEIARILRRRNGDVIAALNGYGLAIPPSREWLLDHYVDQEESVDQIAEHFNRDESSVRRWLREFDIPIRYKKRSANGSGKWAGYHFSFAQQTFILQRDGFQCRMPGCTRRDALEMHHIRRWHDSHCTEVANGITLCGTCHRKIRHYQNDYIPIFQTLITVLEPLA